MKRFVLRMGPMDGELVPILSLKMNKKQLDRNWIAKYQPSILGKNDHMNYDDISNESTKIW